jgi:hypothetical protein
MRVCARSPLHAYLGQACSCRSIDSYQLSLSTTGHTRDLFPVSATTYCPLFPSLPYFLQFARAFPVSSEFQTLLRGVTA